MPKELNDEHDQLVSSALEYFAPPDMRTPRIRPTGILGVTIHQPWSWCISDSDKRLENRE